MKKCSLFGLILVVILMLNSILIFAAELPIEFYPEIKQDQLRPDLVDNYRELNLQLFFEGNDPGEYGAEMNLWIAELDGHPSTVLAGTLWPEDVDKSISLQKMGATLSMSVEWFGETYANLWGEEWLLEAEKKVEEYADINYISRSYNIEAAPGKTYSIKLEKPYFDLKSLQVYSGTYLIISELINKKVYQPSSNEWRGGVGNKELANGKIYDFSDGVPVEYYIGEWETEAPLPKVKLKITDYLASNEDENMMTVYDYYAGEVEVDGHKIGILEVPEDPYADNAIYVEKMGKYSTLHINYYDEIEYSFQSKSGSIFDNYEIGIADFKLRTNNTDYYLDTFGSEEDYYLKRK